MHDDPISLRRASFEAAFCSALGSIGAAGGDDSRQDLRRHALRRYWNVSIITQSGACDRSYNFAVSIVDGRLDGANGALLGTVNSKGGVNVMMGGGDRRGSASGRLAGNSGSGRWSGSATGASCSGRWTAQRG